MTWKDRYRAGKFAQMKKSTPAAFEACGGEEMKINYPKVESTNGLTRAICEILNFEGHHAERTNNQGRMVDNKKTYVDVVGRQRVIGSVEWQKGTGVNGTSDIKADIVHPNYRFAIPIKIEVKWAKDRQSKDQQEYQQSIESKKGIYVIAKNIDQFLFWFDGFMLSLNNGS